MIKTIWPICNEIVILKYDWHIHIKALINNNLL